MSFFHIVHRHLCLSASVSNGRETSFASILRGMKYLKEKSLLERMVHFAVLTGQGFGFFLFWERKCTF